MPLPNFKQITFPCTMTKDTPWHPGPNWSSFSLTCDRTPIPLPFSHQALTHWFSLLPWNSLILILGPSYFLFLPPGRPFLLLPTFPSGLSTNAIPQEALHSNNASLPASPADMDIYIYIFSQHSSPFVLVSLFILCLPPLDCKPHEALFCPLLYPQKSNWYLADQRPSKSICWKKINKLLSKSVVAICESAVGILNSSLIEAIFLEYNSRWILTA